jgi:hypothetical protein
VPQIPHYRTISSSSEPFRQCELQGVRPQSQRVGIGQGFDFDATTSETACPISIRFLRYHVCPRQGHQRGMQNVPHQDVDVGESSWRAEDEEMYESSESNARRTSAVLSSIRWYQ